MKRFFIILLALLVFAGASDTVVCKSSFKGKKSKAKTTNVKPVKSTTTKSNTTPKKGTGLTKKIVDAGARGFGGQLGRDAAKGVVKKVKEVVKKK